MDDTASQIRSAIFAGFEKLAEYFFVAGLCSGLFLLTYIAWPEAIGSWLRTNGIDPVIPVSIAALLTAVASPLVLFSASVGMWRMHELSGDEHFGERVFGRAFGVIGLGLGLGMFLIPVLLLVRPDLLGLQEHWYR
jgi:hypothetical protein